MSGFVTLFVAAIFTDNIVTAKLLGVDELYDKDRSLISLLKKCGVLTALLLLSSAATYPVQKWILKPLGAEYLSAFAFALIICGMLFALYLISKSFLPKLFAFLRENSRVLACSALVLGLCLSIFQNDLVTDYWTALLYSFASGVGFTLVSLIFFAVRERLNETDLPECVKGLPITLLIASLLSLAFSGFAGI